MGGRDAKRRAGADVGMDGDLGWVQDGAVASRRQVQRCDGSSERCPAAPGMATCCGERKENRRGRIGVVKKGKDRRR